MKNRKCKRGFTLLEILVVITLIIIIAGIALPRFKGVSDEGRRAKAAAELKTLQTALESYILNTNNAPPANLAALKTALEAASPRLVGEMDRFVDPFSSLEYRYEIDTGTTAQYYVLFSVGPNRTAGITGISTVGAITGTPGDDIFATNGQLPS